MMLYSKKQSFMRGFDIAVMLLMKVCELAVALGPPLRLRSATSVTSSYSLRAKKKEKHTSSEWISLECCDMCTLVAKTPSKESDQSRRANSRSQRALNRSWREQRRTT